MKEGIKVRGNRIKDPTGPECLVKYKANALWEQLFKKNGLSDDQFIVSVVTAVKSSSKLVTAFNI